MRRQVLVVNEIDALGLAVATRGQKLVTRLGERAFKAIELEFERGAFKAVAGVVDAHMAGAFELVVGLVVLDAVSAHRGRAASQFSIALDHRFQVRPA